MPNRNTFKKHAWSYLEDLDESSEELEELRWEKWLLAQEKEDRQRAETLAARWRQYFFSDGICRAHDAKSCRECRHYANGGCPSYWEEKRIW